jgi:hypothetical protein
MSDDKNFVDGLFIKDIPDSAPAWILGSYSININKFKAWLDSVENQAVKGWINITIKKSQKGSRYAELDTYKPSSDAPQASSGYEKAKALSDSLKPQELPVVDVNDDMPPIEAFNDEPPLNVEDISFN